MNSSADNEAMASDMKRVLRRLDPRTWSLAWKVRLNFFLRAIVAVGLMIGMINFFQRRITLQEVNEKLVLLTDAKARYVEDHFNYISQKLNSFSAERQTIEAMSQLSEAFLNIENDNYVTSTVTGLDKINTLIEGFYSAEILPVLEASAIAGSDLKTMLPDDKKQRILQYLYLAANSKPMGAKSTINKADDGSAYSFLHAQFHPEMLRFARETGLADILFVDYKSGYVTYSLSKNLDFASNLFNGPYRNSALGLAFKNAIGQPSGSPVTIMDASLYLPALQQPQLFMSAPVYSGSQLLGAVVFAMNIASLDAMLELDKENQTAGKSLKALVIGEDFLYRCNDPGFKSDRESYLRSLKRHAISGKTAYLAEKIGTTALIQSVERIPFANAMKGKKGVTNYNSETGEKILCAYSPLQIDRLNWMLVTQVDQSDAMSAVHRFLLIMTVVALLIAAILYYMSGITSNAISERLTRLRDKIIALSTGEGVKDLESDTADEIGQAFRAVGKLSKRIEESVVFLAEMGKGNFGTDFQADSHQDQLGASLNDLKKSLMVKREEEEKRQKDDEVRNWTTHGIAMFNDILRSDNHDLEKLSFNIVRNVIQYLSANQGGLFLMEEEDGNNYLDLVASYAYDRQKFLTKKIQIGEGLAGNCALEKKTVLLNRIPDNYLEITSGLGKSKPGCLMIVPLKKDDDVLGVLEIASFNDFKPHEVEFVEKVAESIAASLITVKLHHQTSQYLEKFQQQAEEMKAQDEELRQSIEELQATHEQMERLKQEEEEHNKQIIKEMEDYRKLLINVLDQIPGKIFVKDHDGKLLLLNSEVAKVYNKSVDELIGTTDFDNHTPEEAREYRAKELDIMAHGAETYIQEETLTGTKRYLKTTKMPFYLPHLGKTGLLGIQLDVTDISQIQEENKQKEAELQREKSLLDALLSNVPEHIYFKDKDSRFIRFSQSMVKLFGLEKAEDLVGKSDFDFFSEEHSRPAYEDEQRIIETGIPIIDLEEKEVMEDGRVSWVNTTKMPLRDSKGEIMGTFGISKDISRIKNLEMEAREMLKTIDGNRKLLIDILNKIPAKVFLKDENGVFVIVNAAVASIYNKTPEQIIGTSDYDNHPNEDVDSWRAQELEIIRKGETSYLHLEKVKGKPRYLNTTKMPFVLATTGKTGLLGIQFDVTDLKVMEELVHKLKAEVERLKK